MARRSDRVPHELEGLLGEGFPRKGIVGHLEESECLNELECTQSTRAITQLEKRRY